MARSGAAVLSVPFLMQLTTVFLVQTQPDTTASDTHVRAIATAPSIRLIPWIVVTLSAAIQFQCSKGPESSQV